MNVRWETTRLKYIADCNRRVLAESTSGDRTFKYVDIGAVDQGSITMPDELTSFTDAPSRARRLAEPGDTIISTVRTYLRAVATVPETDEDLVFSTGFAVLHPRSDVSQRFLAYVLQGDAFVDRVVANSVGVSYPAINASELMALDLLLPPLDEQRAIADYLDQETTQIDSLLTKQEEFIGLLKERRISVRSALATRGGSADDDVNLTDLVWAPEVPAKWRVVPLTSIAKMESGHTPSRSRPEWWKDTYIPWISLNDVSALSDREYIAETVNLVSDAGIANSSARLLPAGTVVLSRDATIGRSAIMEVPMATSQHFANWICGPALNPRYLWLLFTSAMQQYFDSLTDGSTIKTIGMGDLRAFKIPLPSPNEQEHIVSEAHQESSRIDTLIAKAEEHIALAKERRAALITAAVTGQVDVRTARKAG